MITFKKDKEENWTILIDNEHRKTSFIIEKKEWPEFVIKTLKADIRQNTDDIKRFDKIQKGIKNANRK